MTMTPPGGTARGRPRWMHRTLRWSAYVVAVACVVFTIILGTARATVLNEGFYRDALDEVDAYDRVYGDVLVDPAVTPVTDRLLAGLPVPAAAVTANLKLVLPPSTLRTMVDDQLESTVRWLRGEGPDQLRLRVDLRPVLDNIAGVGQSRLGDLIEAAPERVTSTAAELVRQLGAAIGALARGERPEILPDLAASSAVVRALASNQRVLDTATEPLLRAVPADARAEVQAQVEVALRAGDVEGALAAVGPHILAPRVGAASVDLTRLSGGPDWDIGVVLDPDVYGEKSAPLRQVRAIASLGLGPVGIATALLGVLALVVLWITAAAVGADRLRSIGAVFVSTGVISAAALLLAWLGRDGWTAPAGWPRSVADLVHDLRDELVRGVTLTWLGALAVMLVVGALLVVHRRLRMPAFVQRPVPAAVATGIAAAAFAVVILVGGYVTTAVAAGEAPMACNGQVELCDRRYDEVTYLGTHNAMSSTEDRFIGPMHDPSIATQLDQGVRALLIDTWRWERSEQFESRLAEAEFTDATKALVAAVLNRVDPSRPGLWLCHSVCRAGAIPLAETLDDVRGWLDANEHEVVTMIIQDATTAQETQDAFEDAGLLPYLAIPPAAPDGTWPTLTEMIESGRRLVVFAEEADGPAPWYRNFYRFGMETPYAFRTPAEMSCVPYRGGDGKQLFLLNHWVTPGGASRENAAIVNRRQFIIDRASRCATDRGRAPTIIAVDFATIGDALAAVDELNQRR